MMKKVEKGDFGYIRYEKKKRILITVIAFAIPLLIYATGLWQTKTRNNLFTFVAIMGCLPAAKCAVSMVVICMQKAMEPKLYEQLKEHVKDMTVIYEATVSSYEKNISMPCIVVTGLNVVCYCDDAKADAAFAEKHLKKILQGNSYRANVKVFKEVKPFLRRIDELYPNHEEAEAAVPFTPDARYPDASRNELVKHVIMAVCV